MNPLQIAQLLTVVLCLAPSVSARWHLPVATAPLNQDGDEHALYRGRLIEEGTRPTLGIVSMVKDDSLDMFEWIEHHIGIGVSKFFIYDNNSKKPIASLVQRYIEQGFVKVINVTYVSNPGKKEYYQAIVYNQALRAHWDQVDWLAFFDADEYLFMANSSDTHIGDVLRDYDEFSGLGVNWIQFSSSGYESRPLGGLRVNYHRCLPANHFDNRHIKTIVHTSKPGVHKEVQFEGPHSLTCVGHSDGVPYSNATTHSNHTNHVVVDELKRRVVGPWSQSPSHTRLALLHYVIKSKEDFARKRQRGSAQGNHKPWSFFDAINSMSNTSCTQAQQYVAALRQQQAQPFDLTAWLQDVAVRVGATVNDALDNVSARRRTRFRKLA